MCPDAELLSAWSDGEVPQPWSDRLASHVAGCHTCGTKVAAWRSLGAELRNSVPAGEAVLVRRLGERLELALAKKRASKTRDRRSEPQSGKASSLAGSVSPEHSSRLSLPLRLPLPLAAAAALALLLIGGVSGGLLAGLTKGPIGASPEASLASASGSVSPNMETLVRYLEAQNAPLNITIQLPAGGAARSAGEPMIVKTQPLQTLSWPSTGSAALQTTDNQGK